MNIHLYISKVPLQARARVSNIISPLKMAHIAGLVILLLLSTSVATTALAESLFKSVGPDGKITYSDHPPTEGRILKTMQLENLPSSALPASTASYVEQLTKLKASSSAIKSISGVVLYAAAWCGYCKKAKAYLASKSITYREIDIDTNDGIAAFAQAGGGKGVPLLIADGQRIQGFSTAAYDALFAKQK